MESKKINQLATELAPELSDLTIIGDPTTGISKKITLSQMASLFTGTVEEYANLAAFPLVGTADTIYIALDTNIIYRWNTGTSAYVELSPNIVTSLVFNDANGFDGTISLVGSTATLTITTALTQGSIGFIGASGALTQDNSNFFWDNTNKRLGINTNAPTTAIDAFGSGIIGRLNGTSTNNAFLGFASAGTNKWSIGNVQSDHRFRIYSEANTAELVSVLQTGEVGIGIANPTTKLHIDGGASALIANLDANVSVAKSISFRSDNSARINLEVSGTESGSNAGANFFIRRYSDAGALIDTPLTITRSTGTISLATALSGTSATFNDSITLNKTSGSSIVKIQTATASVAINVFKNSLREWEFGCASDGSLTLYDATAVATRFTISSTGAATFSNTIQTNGNAFILPSIGGGGSGGVYLGVFPDTQYSKQAILTERYTSTSGNYGRGSLHFCNRDTADTNLPTLADSRMVITSSGNVGIGTSSPNFLVQVNKSDGGASVTQYTNADTGSASSNGLLCGIDSGEDGLFFHQGAKSLRFGTSDAERMRITSGGYTKISNNGTYLGSTGNYHELRSNASGTATTVISNTSASFIDNVLAIGTSKGSSTDFNHIAAYTSDFSNIVFKVRGDGNVYNVNGVYTSGVSDIKYKEQIIDANSQWEDIKNLRVVNFKFIKDVKENGEDALKHIGFIAQEVEKVSPNLIEEITNNETNETWKTIKTSIIHTKAIKALQEAMEKIEILEEKVKQLESK